MRNREGLTWNEWLQAATWFSSNPGRASRGMRRAWFEGEDPTEWAAVLP